MAKTKEEIVPKLDPKTDGSSMDVVQTLVDQLRPIVPEAFTEGKIDFEVLRELLGDDVEERQERYSFTWPLTTKVDNPRSDIFVLGGGSLIVCLNELVDGDDLQFISETYEKLQSEFVRVVFKDSGFKDDVAKTNAIQILRQRGIEDVKTI